MAALQSGLVLAWVAVNYGWVPASYDADEQAAADAAYEYVVQVDAEELRALAEGRVTELSSAPPAELRRIERVTFVVGDEPPPRELTAVDRTSPRRIAGRSGPIQQTVAKPVAPEWLPPRDSSQGHTTYQNPSALEQGFANAANDLGQATQQTGQDLRDGAVGVLGGLRDAVTSGVEGTADVINNTVNIGNDDYWRQQQQQAAAAPTPQPAAPNRFEPYSYNTPSAAELSPPPAQPQVTPSQYTAPPATPYNGATPQAGAPTAGGQLANQYGLGSNSAASDTSGGSFNQYERPLAPVSRVNTVSQPQPAAPPANALAPAPQTPSYTRGADPSSTMAPAAGRTPPPASAWDTPQFGGPSLQLPQQTQTPPAHTQRQPAQSPAPPANQMVNYAQPAPQSPGQNPSGARSWTEGMVTADAMNANVTPTARTANGDQKPDRTNPFNDAVVLVLLLASVFGNFYVVTGYLDVRNKYLATLRRLPTAMQPPAA